MIQYVLLPLLAALYMADPAAAQESVTQTKTLQSFLDEMTPDLRATYPFRSFETARTKLKADLDSVSKQSPWSTSVDASSAAEYFSTEGLPQTFTISGQLKYETRSGFNGTLSSTYNNSSDINTAPFSYKRKVNLTFSQEVIQGAVRPTLAQLNEQQQTSQVKSELYSTQSNFLQTELEFYNILMSLYHDHCLEKDISDTLKIIETAYQASLLQVENKQISMKDHLSTVNLRDRFLIQSSNLKNNIQSGLINLQKFSNDLSIKAKNLLTKIDSCEAPEALDLVPIQKLNKFDTSTIPSTDSIRSQLSEIESQKASLARKELEDLPSLKPYFGIEQTDQLQAGSGYSQVLIGFTFTYILDSELKQTSKKAEFEGLNRLTNDLEYQQQSLASQLNVLAHQLESHTASYAIKHQGYKNSLLLLDILQKQSSLGLTDVLAQVSAYTNWFERISEIREAIKNYNLAKIQYRQLTEDKFAE